MSYVKQNFQSGAKLYASQLNSMDNQIAQNESDITQTKEDLFALSEGAEGTITGRLSESITEMQDELFDESGEYYWSEVTEHKKGRICVATGIASFPDGKIMNDGTDSTYEYVEIPVNANEAYRIDRSIITPKVASYCFYRADGSVISIYPTVAGVSETITNRILDVPENAKTLKVCGSLAGTGYLKVSIGKQVKAFKKENVQSAVDSIESENGTVIENRRYVDTDNVRKTILRQRNEDKFPYDKVWGGEYLEHWYERIFDGTNNVKIALDGDSITQGYTGDNVYIGMRDDALKKIMKSGGYELSKLTVFNNGVGGTSVNDWVGKTQYFKDSWKSQTYYDKYANGMLHYSMDANPDLLIIGFGMNDANIEPTVLNLYERLDLFESGYREGLERIRKNVPVSNREAYNRSVDNLSIIITAPTNTASTTNEGIRQYQNWQMYTKEILMHLCREYKCAFADFTKITYGYTEADYKSWYQYKDGIGTPLHPNKYQVMYWMSALSELIYPVCMHNISID